MRSRRRGQRSPAQLTVPWVDRATVDRGGRRQPSRAPGPCLTQGSPTAWPGDSGIGMGARGRDRREGRTGQKVQRLVGDAWAAGGARARKNYAGTSPITRASGKKKVVLARYVRNKRLADVLHHQVFSALNVSPGARAYYDALRTATSATTRLCASWATASSASCTAASKRTPPTTRPSPGTSTPNRRRRETTGGRRPDEHANPAG